MSQRDSQSSLNSLKSLSEGLLRGAGLSGRRGNVLEIRHDFAPCFDKPFLHCADEGFGVSLSLTCARDGDPDQSICCDSALLPFQGGSFRAVVLHHVISDGFEPELAEACRVLQSNGTLIVLGLNRMAWRYRFQDKDRPLPGLAPLAVRNRLVSLGMSMRGFAGAGLGGRQAPALLRSGPSAACLPLADLLILEACKEGGPLLTPLRRAKGAAVVQSLLAAE